jgi:hypothetical protein
MLVFRFGKIARLLSVAVLIAAGGLAFAVPAKADDTARAPQAKRSTASLNNAGAVQAGPNFSGGFQFIPGAPGMNIGGRVNVGKSKLYVPYYGNISSDPAHPGVQGTAGIAYGFRTWDISVLNGSMGTQQAPVPGVDTPKVNPALSLSIRF